MFLARTVHIVTVAVVAVFRSLPELLLIRISTAAPVDFRYRHEDLRWLISSLFLLIGPEITFEDFFEVSSGAGNMIL